MGGMPAKNPPSHWNVTFKKAPPGPWTCKRKTVPPTPARLNGASLFCFTFVSKNYGKKQMEDFQILAFAQKEHTHIFACDHWAVFSDVDAPLSPGKTTKVAYPKVAKRPQTKVWVNSFVFINVWKSINDEGAWRSYQKTQWAFSSTTSTSARLSCLSKMVRTRTSNTTARTSSWPGACTTTASSGYPRGRRLSECQKPNLLRVCLSPSRALRTVSHRPGANLRKRSRRAKLLPRSGNQIAAGSTRQGFISS